MTTSKTVTPWPLKPFLDEADLTVYGFAKQCEGAGGKSQKTRNNGVSLSELKRWQKGHQPKTTTCEAIAKELARLIHQRNGRRAQPIVFAEILRACGLEVRLLLWPVVRSRCEANIKSRLESNQSAGDALYVPRSIDGEFARFIAGSQTAMVVAGESGKGKTTFAEHALKRCLDEGHLCLFVPGSALPKEVADVEEDLIERLLEGYDDKKDFWSRIEAECATEKRRLIICIDAVNEYDGTGRHRGLAMEFLHRLDRIIHAAHQRKTNVRFLITSRPQTWQRAVAGTRVRPDSEVYFVTEAGTAFTLERFSEQEAIEANRKYFAEYRISAPDLSARTLYDLRDPLLLKIACDIHKKSTLPRDLDTRKLLSKFHEDLCERAESLGIAAGFLIECLVDQMFRPRAGGQVGHVIRGDTTVRDTELALTQRPLFDLLKWEDHGSVAFFLVDQSVIRADGRNVRFVYDRYAEYLLSQRLVERITGRGVSSDTASEAFEVLRANLDEAPSLPTVFGALRQALLELSWTLGPGSRDYGALLRRLATHDGRDDERGMALVASVMAEIAMRSDQANDGMGALAALLEGLRSETRSRTVAFPVIDAVYRVLCDEAYRAWLKDHPEWREGHLRVLDEEFVLGFGHLRDDVWGAAIQYLFFLWQSLGAREEAREDAIRITRGVVDKVNPGLGALAQPVFLRNLTTLFLVIFADARDDDAAGEILALLARLLRRLRSPGTRFEALRQGLVEMLAATVLDLLLPLYTNPVNHNALLDIFDSEGSRRDIQLVLRALEAETRWDPSTTFQELSTLARSENGIVIELFALALSARHERLDDAEERARHLRSIAGLFDSGSRVAEYASSLALYHINYYGRHATTESMSAMDRMARRILSDCGGEFTLGKETFNFHIIGTYGRALRRNRHLLPGSARNGGPLLGFALEALEAAKQSGRLDRYKYVCKNIGLLGTLMPSADVLPVVSRVLEDLGIKAGADVADRARFPFTQPEAAEIRKGILGSLANFRVLYRSDTDRYLLDVVDSPVLFAEVATKHRPAFKLGEFMSWTSEQLFFSLLGRYYDQLGRELLGIMRRGFTMSRKEGARYFIGQLFDRVMVLASEAPGG